MNPVRALSIGLAAVLAACGGGDPADERTASDRAFAASVAGEREDPIVQQHAVDYYSRKHGVAPDEARRRVELQDRAAGIEDDLERVLGAQYAGIWFDAADRGRLKVGLTFAAQGLQAELRSVLDRYGLGADADLVSVRSTETELEARVLDVKRALAQLMAAGSVRIGYATDINSVVLTSISALSADDRRRVEEQGRRDGVVLRFVDAPHLRPRVHAYSCGVRRCDPPLRGGREIRSPFTSPYFPAGLAKACTAAFVARHRVTHELLLMTAGHCLSLPEFQTWRATDQSDQAHVIGNTYGWVWGGGDTGVIKVNPDSPWAKAEPWVVVKASDDTTYNPAYPIRRDGKSSLYTIKCMTGRTTGTHCGEVIGLGFSATFDDDYGNPITVDQMGVIDACVAAAGDSGGPLYKKNVAYGSWIGGTVFPDPACDGYYQGIRGAENLLNVDVLFAP